MAPTNNDEEYDSFPTNGATTFVFDMTSLAVDRGNGRAGGGRSSSSLASRSAATTQLASHVGSTVGAGKDPFLKSITFFDPRVYCRSKKDEEAEQDKLDSSEGGELKGDSDDPRGEDGCLCARDSEDDMTCEVNDLTHWDITLRDPSSDDFHFQRKRGGVFGKLGKVGTSFGKGNRPRLIVDDFEGLVEFSSLRPGDRLVSINKKKIKPEDFSAEAAMAFMRQCLKEDGVLHVTSENPQGQDILINVTVIKPLPNMTYDDLGLIVWNWPFLCVRKIKKGSIFQHTAIKETDQIAAINDIDCSKMKEESFARCVLELPTEITITLIRRKHRYTGSYN